MSSRAGSADPAPNDLLDWAGRTVADCPIGLAVGVLGDRWSLLVLRELAFGVDRFDAVQAHLGISRRTLSERFEALLEADIVQRVPYRDPGQRTRHRYQLTAAGDEVLPLLMALAEWGEHYRRDGTRSAVRMVHAECGGSVHSQLRCSAGHDVRDVADVTPGLRSPRQR